MLAFIEFDCDSPQNRWVRSEVTFRHDETPSVEKCHYCSSKQAVVQKEVIIENINITYRDTAGLTTEEKLKERIEKITRKCAFDKRNVCDNTKCQHDFGVDLSAGFFKRGYSVT